MNNTHQQTAAAQKADRHFQKEMRDNAGVAAWSEYQASQNAIREKTARLKELRLARDAALPKAPAKPNRPKRKSSSRASSKQRSPSATTAKNVGESAGLDSSPRR
jgi:hypothetical protein